MSRYIALNEAKVEIRIQFKDVTQGIFKDISRDELVIRLQPQEAVYLKLNMKSPGLYTRAIPTEMDLTYKRRFADVHIPEAYESLILDALKGDHSNFVRDDELDVAWKVCPILPLTPCVTAPRRRRRQRVQSPAERRLILAVLSRVRSRSSRLSSTG